MKHVRLLTILIALIAVISLAFAVMPAYASERKVDEYESPRGYTLTSLKRDGKVIGVGFYGIYFGSSDIAVSCNIYSSSALTVDFSINEEENKLTSSQLEVKAKLIALADEIHSFIVQIDNVANTQYDGTGDKSASDIYNYNSASYGKKLEINEHTYKMLEIAREMYAATKGAFNPAVYRLVDLWGFSSRIYANGNFGLPYDREVSAEQFFRNGYPLPEKKYIDAFSAPSFTDFSENAVSLSTADGKFFVTKNVPAAVVDGVSYEQWLDLGGIAKGYVVDKVKAMLSERGITRYSVDAGTSSQAYGKNYSDGDYNLGITDPFENILLNRAMLSVNISDCTVSTSGQYVRKYTTDGTEYSHIIDGTLGAPAQTGIKLVSVIAPENNFWAGKGDCLTTALTVMGRDRIVEFMNGYLKENGVKVIVAYETVDGQKQILSNYVADDVIADETFDNFAWAITLDEQGNFAYDFDARANSESNKLLWLAIALGAVVVALAVVVIVLHFLKGKRGAEQNVISAKRDKPFKVGDVGAYIAVALLIVILFVVFFGGETEKVKVIKVMDFSKSSDGEQLFAYNVSRNEWEFYEGNSNGWTVEVTEDGNNINVTFRREIEGEPHFNTMTITRGASVKVKMTDSVCGRNQECVRNFGEISLPNGTIVCSPNRLKIITE